MSRLPNKPVTRVPFGHRLVCLAAGLLLCTAALAANPAGKHVVLTTHSLSSSPGLSLRLAVAPCSNKVCKIFVQLTEGDKVINQLPLAWVAHTQVYSQDMVGRWYGAGDPLDDKVQWQAWTIGESEHDFVVVVTQPLVLEKGIHGLAVHQTAGFEHTRRHHTVYLVKNGKLILAWQKTEGSGPVWSTLVNATDTGHVSQLTYIEALQTGDEISPDQLDIRYLGWNPNTEKLQTNIGKQIPLYYIVVHPFDNIPAARAFGKSNASCLGNDYLLLGKRDIKNKTLPAKYAYVAVTHLKPLAERARSNLASCLPANTEAKIDVF